MRHSIKENVVLGKEVVVEPGLNNELERNIPEMEFSVKQWSKLIYI